MDATSWIIDFSLIWECCLLSNLYAEYSVSPYTTLARGFPRIAVIARRTGVNGVNTWRLFPDVYTDFNTQSSLTS